VNLLELSDVIRITVIGVAGRRRRDRQREPGYFFTRNPAPRFLSMSLGFAAGMMLEVSFLELIPEAIAQGNFSFRICRLDRRYYYPVAVG